MEGRAEESVARRAPRSRLTVCSDILGTIGDKGTNALVHFGAPVAHENETERALDFALELHRLCHRVARLRAGITRDVRWVGFNGGTRRREFACLGRATNLAARLMMGATWGDLVCDARVASDAEASYTITPRGEAKLKGFELPVSIFAVGERRASFREPRELGAKALVGRGARARAPRPRAARSWSSRGGRGDVRSRDRDRPRNAPPRRRLDARRARSTAARGALRD